MADTIDLDGINAKVIGRDVINANVGSVIQRVKTETEEIIVTPKTETQVIEHSVGKLINKVHIEAVTASIDSDIQEENIKAGTNILGKNGTFTSDATATADDILENETAYVNGEKITGTLVPLDTSDATATANDILAPATAYVNGEKITGEYVPLDTTDATATAEDIAKDKTAYVNGVKITGTYEGSGGGSGETTIEGIKQFASIEEMNSSTGNNEGDLAVVYGEGFKDLIVGETYTKLYLPKTIVLDKAITSTTNIWFSSGTSVLIVTHWVRLTKTAIQFYRKSGFTGSVMNTVKYESTDGKTYTRTDSLAEVLTIEEIYQNYYTSIAVQETNFNILKQMFKSSINIFEGLYVYKSNTWEIAPSQLDAESNFVYESTFYGVNGVEKGTLQESKDLLSYSLKLKVEVWNVLNNLSLNSNESTTNLLSNNEKIVSLPNIDFSGVDSIAYLCYNTPNLTNIPLFDTSTITNMNNTFGNCPNLTNESLNNILAMCINAVNYEQTKTLEAIGLSEEQANICKTLSNYPAFIEAGWMANIKELYAKSVENIITTAPNNTPQNTDKWAVVELADGNVYLMTNIRNTAGYLIYIDITYDACYQYICNSSSSTGVASIRNSCFYKWNGSEFVYQFESKPDSSNHPGKLVRIIGCGSTVNNASGGTYQGITKLVEGGEY